MCDILCFPFPKPPGKKKAHQSSPTSSTERINGPIDDLRQIDACIGRRSSKIQQSLGISWLHPRIFQLSVLATSLAILRLLHRRIVARYWRRYKNVDDVPGSLIGRRVLILGRVTNVGDPDNFRLFHKPWLKLGTPVPAKLAGETIHIRIGGADAPEAEHSGFLGGRPAQKGSDEAWKWLEDAVLNQDVIVELEHKDQFRRIVGNVYSLPNYIPSFLLPFVPSYLLRSSSRNVSLRMIRAGWAHIYQDKNACYGGWDIELFREAEAYAKKKRLGVWKDGLDVETPGQYKKRHKTPTPSPTIDIKDDDRSDVDLTGMKEDRKTVQDKISNKAV